MDPVHEKYLLGEMGEEDRSRLEQELAQDPSLRAQLDEELQFIETLKDQMLRRKINAALAGPDAPNPVSSAKKNQWGLWLGLVGLLLLSWAIWKNLSGNPANEPPAPAAPQQQLHEEPSVPVAEQPTVPIEKDDAPEKKGENQIEVIAQAPVEPHSLKGLRGNESGRTAWRDLVEKIWNSSFPPAETFGSRFKPAAEALSKGNATDAFPLLRTLERQTPPNDTLAFLKGWCLMELWEGKEALRSFNQLSDRPHPWKEEVEWGTGQCYLLTGEKEKAVTVIINIASQPKHAYRIPAEKALKLLR